MTHEVSVYDFELPTIDDWLAGDDRTLAFTVTDGDGNSVDIQDATVYWEVFERPYQTDSANTVLDGGDSDVEIVTDSRVDSSKGEFEVRVDGEATDDIWGAYWHRPRVEEEDGSEVRWRGKIILAA